MSEQAVALILYLLLVTAAAVAIVAITAAVGRRAGTAARDRTYECGLDQATPRHHRVEIQYFLIAALFLVFDVEIVLLFPWAVAFRTAAAGGGGLVFLELAVFLGLLATALVFALGQGALEWERESVTRDS